LLQVASGSDAAATSSESAGIDQEPNLDFLKKTLEKQRASLHSAVKAREDRGDSGSSSQDEDDDDQSLQDEGDQVVDETEENQAINGQSQQQNIIKTRQEGAENSDSKRRTGSQATALERRPQVRASLHHVLRELVLVISDLTAACLNIERVVGQSYEHSHHHFQVFLQVLEVFGCGYADDVDGRGYKIRDQQSHRQAAIKQLQDIQKMYDIAIQQVVDDELFSVTLGHLGNRSEQKVNSKVLKNQLLSLLNFQRAHFCKLEMIQQKQTRIPDANVDFENLPQGHYAMMTCGHRGIPCRQEEKRVSRLLRKSGFIPMLETIQDQSKKKLFTDEPPGASRQSEKDAAKPAVPQPPRSGSLPTTTATAVPSRQKSQFRSMNQNFSHAQQTLGQYIIQSDMLVQMAPTETPKVQAADGMSAKKITSAAFLQEFDVRDDEER